MANNTTKTAVFKTFEAARLTAGKYAGIPKGIEKTFTPDPLKTYEAFETAKNYGSNSRKLAALTVSQISASGLEYMGFFAVPAGLKAAARMARRVSGEYSGSRFSFGFDAAGRWSYEFDDPYGMASTDGSAEDVGADGVASFASSMREMHAVVWALASFDVVQLWKNEKGFFFFAVGNVDDGRVLLLNSGMEGDFMDPSEVTEDRAEVVEAVATYPAEPVAACKAPKADESDEKTEKSAENCKNSTKNGVRIEKNAEFGSIEIYFNVKPSKEMRDALKGLKFRWHSVKKCWYGYTDEETARRMIEAAEGAEAIKAGNVTETAQEGENARGGVEVCPEAETAPEAKETANAEAVPDSVRNYEKAAAMLETLESQVSDGESLPEHWRRVWKACGLKGVTVSSGRGGYTRSYTFKFTMMRGDLLPFDNCREALEEQARERLARGVWDDEKGGYIDYFHMTGDEQRAEETRQARKYWEKVQAEGSRFSICHYWQINRKNSPEFSESFWRRWELVGRSVARLNYDHSDAMTDYFDVGFYEDWEIKPEGKATYKPAEWYAVENLYNLAKARDEKAEAERKAKEEAEAKKESEEREAHYYDLEEKARESVSTWSEAFPYASGVDPFVTVEWCEINAMHETGEEHAQEEGTPATRWSLDAFNMVTEDLDRYVKGCGWFGYFKCKYTVEFPDGYKYTDRIDLGDGVGGLVESARSIVKYNEDRKAAGEEFGGTIYGGSVDELRERLDRLEAATDPDAVAMARGILELGETA